MVMEDGSATYIKLGCLIMPPECFNVVHVDHEHF